MMYKEGVIVATTVSSILYSWLIPSSLFIFINLVIASIFIISRFTSSSSSSAPKALIHDSLQLLRSNNPLLDRLTSFNHHHQYTQTCTESTQPQPAAPPSILERVKSFNLGLLLYKPNENLESNPEKQKLDLAPLAPFVLQQVQSMKEPEAAVSEMEGVESKESDNDADDEDEGEEDGKWLNEEKEIGVKADDFISMFKNQLRLQRVDSFNAYRDMLN